MLALEEREEMGDEEMVDYLARCQLRPDMPRGSIETLLHAFVPYAQVDHTHPDAINKICCAEGGEELAHECFGEEMVWIPYIRPGFTLSKQVGQAVRNNPDAKFVLLAKHGLVTWGDTHEEADEEMFDPNPRVVLIAGLGLVAAAKNAKEANLSRDFVYRAINVIRGAHALGGYVSLTDEESYAVEYWLLELYKLTLAPPPDELAGRVAFVTGGAGGIGSAIARSLASRGACIVVCDLDEEGATGVADDLPEPGIAARADVTDEDEVTRAYRRAVLEYGGVDVVVSNAGLASSAPIEETSVEMWDKNHAVLAKGYFLVAREAFRIMKVQSLGGSLVFVASKNSLAAGKNASAYSSAKAAELHLARCLAEEGGPERIRVNTVNPDAVLQGSRIWDSGWRQERAAAYGIEPEELEDYYRKRNVLKMNVLPENVAEAVLHFASAARSSRSTGNILNVDGGVKDAYPR